MTASPSRIDAFIARWQGREGGQERANYALFLTELCGVLDVPPPEPAAATTEENDYVFERVVKGQATDGSPGSGRIDLYKRGCFVLEAKQSRQTGGAKEVPHYLPGLEPPRRGVRDASRTWDVLMLNARRQAEGYARALPVAHGWPPFILVCDVGHVIETYADFSGQGKNYAQFPDRQSFRVYLEDLRRPDIRERLARIWTDPMGLDPARETARVTREIAARLAAVSKALEEQGHDAEEVAMFLMRCLFTMFAEDVELLPKSSFRDLLQRCEQDPTRFSYMVGQLWEAMDKGGFAFVLEAKVRQFNGEFFRTRTVLPLGREEIGELRRAASYDWRDVDPSIFGTLLEQALDKAERQRLGAHYTPRVYVERLVVATVIEPLRADWDQALSTAERQKSEGRLQNAEATIQAFHVKLCNTRVLDPACGTGNFLYVALELLKRLEGEVLEALVNLGGQEALTGLEGHTVDPHQFHGLELNPRAAAIAELVLWIGYLQWHFRTKGGMPSEPILRAFHNIEGKFDAILKADKVLARDQHGVPLTQQNSNGIATEIYLYSNAVLPAWPPAEFIVGNPPYVAGQSIREELGAEYLKSLRRLYPHVPGAADLVMYWWDRAADCLVQRHTPLRRFGFVTTRTITHEFSGRVVVRHLQDPTNPISLTLAIPNHPWYRTRESAAVRIAMTVAQSGRHPGVLREVISEQYLDTDEPKVSFSEQQGYINPNLTIGIDVLAAKILLSNEGICYDGVKLHGRGFIINHADAEHLGYGSLPEVAKVIKPYLNGRDINQNPRRVLVIDLFGYRSADDVRRDFPSIYQHVLLRVKPERDLNNRPSRRDNWWLFGENQPRMRTSIADIERFIATADTAKHRIFQFLQNNVICDDKIVTIASDDSFVLGTLSSKIHGTWALGAKVRLGVGDDPVYASTRCFDPYPFPAADDLQKQRIRAIAEDLDAHRKRVLADHPHLTLTGLYNVLEKLRAGTAPDALDPADRRIFDDGLVLILKELHDRLDAAVAAAYGWPADLSDKDILARLVALNQERVREEAAGNICWLRPDYQVPRFGTERDKLALTGGAMREPEAAATAGPKPSFPASELEQTAAVLSVLTSVAEPATATALAARFRQGRRVLPQVEAVLAALVRVGGLVHSPDGGRSFLPRRVA